ANCGYTVTLPEGFIAKNNLAKFEEMGETKIFQNHAINATIDFRVKEETGDAKAEIKRSSAILAADELKTLIKNEVTDNALTATWKDKDGTFNAVYNRIENGKKAIINFSYSAKNEAEFNAAIESVTNSFKLN
ncbi:MAG: hypothetical protein HUK07_07055, partial [Bacteroidaceae bacterium]|nr:hypothetical protein [Bacteroidaceae bacterium]